MTQENKENTMPDYKEEQLLTKEKLKPKVLLATPKGSAPLNLGIKEAKCTMGKEQVKLYKDEVWKQFKDKLKKQKES